MIETGLLVVSIIALVANTGVVSRRYWHMSEHTLIALVAATLGFVLFLAVGDALLACTVLLWGYGLAWYMEVARRPTVRPVPVWRTTIDGTATVLR